jgi:hypothetical protein
MKSEMRKPNTESPKLRHKASGQEIRLRGAPETLSGRAAAPPEGKRSGRARKLRLDAAWRRFTEAEQAHIRDIFERDGLEEAASYCQKIGKTWSGSSISRFFHSERTGGPLQDVTKDTKLRPDSRWWQLTERQRDTVRGIFENHGQMAAEAYCRQIGKPWSHTAISRFFAKQRALSRAENAKLRSDLQWLKALTAIYARAGMDITEATAIELAAKLREAVNISAANPETAEGRAILTKAAPHLIALRALELRREFKSKEIKLAERRVTVLEKKLTAALPKNEEVPDLPDKPESWYAARTEILGRAIFGDNWDYYQPKKNIDPAQSDPIQPNQTTSQTPEAQSHTEANPVKDGQIQPNTTKRKPRRIIIFKPSRPDLGIGVPHSAPWVETGRRLVRSAPWVGTKVREGLAAPKAFGARHDKQ